MTDEAVAPRPGSSADLSRRLDRLEQNHELLAKEVAALTGTIQRVEQNQNHLEELNKLRFGSLDTSVGTIGSKLDAFINRVEGLISGDIQTAQTRAGNELVADYRKWRDQIDQAIEDLVDAREKSEVIANERERVAKDNRIHFQWRLGLLVGVIGSISAAITGALIRVVLGI